MKTLLATLEQFHIRVLTCIGEVFAAVFINTFLNKEHMIISGNTGKCPPTERSEEACICLTGRLYSQHSPRLSEDILDNPA